MKFVCLENISFDGIRAPELLCNDLTLSQSFAELVLYYWSCCWVLALPATGIFYRSFLTNFRLLLQDRSDKGKQVFFFKCPAGPSDRLWKGVVGEEGLVLVPCQYEQWTQ